MKTYTMTTVNNKETSSTFHSMANVSFSFSLTSKNFFEFCRKGGNISVNIIV